MMKGNDMKTMTKSTSLKLALVAPLALTALVAAPHARADSVPPPFGQVTLVSGTESTVNTFSAPSAGTVTVKLQSIDWPASLSALSFSATTATQVLASWNGTGVTSDTATFDVAAGTYFTHVIATAGGTLDLGLYAMLLTFTPNGGTPPIPLPASGWLLLTGMFVLAGLARAMRPFELTGTAQA
jgi:hypothetical protein